MPGRASGARGEVPTRPGAAPGAEGRRPSPVGEEGVAHERQVLQPPRCRSTQRRRRPLRCGPSRRSLRGPRRPRAAGCSRGSSPHARARARPPGPLNRSGVPAVAAPRRPDPWGDGVGRGHAPGSLCRAARGGYRAPHNGRQEGGRGGPGKACGPRSGRPNAAGPRDWGARPRRRPRRSRRRAGGPCRPGSRSARRTPHPRPCGTWRASATAPSPPPRSPDPPW